MMNHYYNGKRLPEYYDTMYLDGYSGDEVYVAFHRSMQKRVSEMQAEKEDITNINMKSEIKIKWDTTIKKTKIRKRRNQY